MWRPPQIDALYNEDVDIGKYTDTDKRKKAKWYQVGLIELGRYAALASTIAAGTTGLPGCCSQYKPLDKNITKQKYLHEEPFNYTAELDCKCIEYSKQGKILENILTRGAWALAVLNGSGKVVASGGLEVVAGDGGKNFALYTFDGTYGGRTFDETVGKILQGKIGEGIKVAYDAEDTGLGGHGKIILVGSSIAAPIVLPLTLHHGHHHHAGAAPVGAGPTPPDPF